MNMHKTRIDTFRFCCSEDQRGQICGEEVQRPPCHGPRGERHRHPAPGMKHWLEPTITFYQFIFFKWLSAHGRQSECKTLGSTESDITGQCHQFQLPLQAQTLRTSGRKGRPCWSYWNCFLLGVWWWGNFDVHSNYNMWYKVALGWHLYIFINIIIFIMYHMNSFPHATM